MLICQPLGRRDYPPVNLDNGDRPVMRSQRAGFINLVAMSIDPFAGTNRNRDVNHQAHSEPTNKRARQGAWRRRLLLHLLGCGGRVELSRKLPHFGGCSADVKMRGFRFSCLSAHIGPVESSHMPELDTTLLIHTRPNSSISFRSDYLMRVKLFRRPSHESLVSAVW
jgi:hypothetical protein